MKMIKYIVVSDECGRLERLELFSKFDATEWIHEQGVDCDCEEDQCDCPFFGEYMVSLYEIPLHKCARLADYQGHPSHYLVEHGEELCLGDYV
jgi:hypothetical protein